MGHVGAIRRAGHDDGQAEDRVSKSHGSRRFSGRLGNQRIEAIYLILMMGANFGTIRITSEANVAFWHEADLRLAARQGPLTVPLPTSGPECRFIAAFQTLCRRVLKDG